jgi:uncharacterized Zn-finger protein
MAKAEYTVNFSIGENGTIRIACPHCGASYPLRSKSNEIVCDYCRKTYVVPRRVLDML